MNMQMFLFVSETLVQDRKRNKSTKIVLLPDAEISAFEWFFSNLTVCFSMGKNDPRYKPTLLL